MASRNTQFKNSRKEKFDPNNFEPVVIKATGEEIEEVLLFVIVDDDETRREYYIPKKVKFPVTMRANEILAEQGENAANLFMLKVLLGEDGYAALMGFEELELEQFSAICDLAAKIVFGAAEGKAR